MKNLPRETVRKLDRKFSTGYILICNYLEFWGDDYDDATPNKKAVVTCSFLGLDHLLDIARERGLLYIEANKLGLEIDCGAVQIKTAGISLRSCPLSSCQSSDAFPTQETFR